MNQIQIEPDQLKTYIMSNLSEHFGKPLTPEIMENLSVNITQSLIDYLHTAFNNVKDNEDERIRPNILIGGFS